MSKLDINNSLIMIIDIQEKLLRAVFNEASCKKKTEILAKVSGILEIPVIITEQYPKGLGSTVETVKNNINENCKFFEKNTFSALDNLEVLNSIKQYNKRQIVVFGIETHICLSQTVSDLIDEGYEVFVVKDASGSRAEEEHNAGLGRMKDNGAKIITTEIALFEWLRGAKHPKFKEVQSLII